MKGFLNLTKKKLLVTNFETFYLLTDSLITETWIPTK